MTEIIDSVDSNNESIEVVVEITCHSCGDLFDYDAENIQHYHTKQGIWDYTTREFTYKDVYACDTCTTKCEDCEKYQTDNEIGGIYTLGNYCGDCTENYRECERCDGIFTTDDVHYVGSGDSCYCVGCINRVANWCSMCDQYEWNDETCTPDSEFVHNYSYKPTPQYHGSSDQKLYFGMELEVEAANGDYTWGAETITDSWGDFVYLKEDSSLNFGFEIVTHPATLDYYQNQVKWNVLDELRNAGFRSWNAGTCGLHVHIDRRAFTDRTHLLAFTYLINRNENMCRHIAGRNSHYGIVNESAKIDNVLTIKRRHSDARGGDRYNAVNLQNTHTVEIRMFKGSLKVERVRSAIQFCHASVEYTRSIRSGANASVMLRPEEFASWVRKQGKYPDLVQYLPDFQITPDENTE